MRIPHNYTKHFETTGKLWKGNPTKIDTQLGENSTLVSIPVRTIDKGTCYTDILQKKYLQLTDNPIKRVHKNKL